MIPTPSDSPLSTVARVIQLSVAPVFLLTAVSTILGVLGTRLGRVVDRARVLVDRISSSQPPVRQSYEEELALLLRRRRLVNRAITSGVCCALLICVLIACAFVGAIVGADFSRPVAVLFIAAMLAFVCALLFFLREIMLAVASIPIGPR